jgi:hypothetical protein
MSRDWIALLIFFGICFAVGASGSVFTASSVKTWYPGLLKPPGTPPPWVFGPVWSILYLLMAAAAWLVWRQHRSVDRHRHDRPAIRGTLKPGILADETLRRLGPLCCLPKLRNLAPE